MTLAKHKKLLAVRTQRNRKRKYIKLEESIKNRRMK